MSSQCQSAEIITSLGALDRVGYLGNEYLLILIRDLEDTVHVVIELYEAATLRRIQSDLQRRSVCVGIRELQRQEISCAPVRGQSTAVNILKRTGDRTVSYLYSGL